MRRGRELLTGLGILAGMVGGVAVAALLIVALVAPPSGDPTPTPEPTFDIGVAPQVIGGRLAVDGDRTGTLVLEEGRGGAARYEVLEDGGVRVAPAGDTYLQGPDGRVRFQRGTGVITLIDYDGLSFYPEPDDCALTLGAVSDDSGLMAALVDCPELSDIRGGGTVSLAGVVALPADVLRGRGDIPRSGGSVDVDGSTITFAEAEIFLDERVYPERERIGWAIWTPDHLSGVAFEYDVDADQFYLSEITVAEEGYAILLEEPCPIGAEELGRINAVTTAVRLTFDCSGVEVPGGGTGSVTGTIVADVIEGFWERGEGAP
jgi:hypothetical protein